MKYISLVFYLLLVLCSGCEKASDDYRYKYVGNSEFNITTSQFNMADSTNEIDTEFYPGLISFGEKESELNIQYSKTESLDVEVDTEGKMLFNSSYTSGAFNGYLEVFYTNRWGGNGGGGSFILRGSKR